MKARYIQDVLPHVFIVLIGVSLCVVPMSADTTVDMLTDVEGATTVIAEKPITESDMPTTKADMAAGSTEMDNAGGDTVTIGGGEPAITDDDAGSQPTAGPVDDVTTGDDSEGSDMKTTEDPDNGAESMQLASRWLLLPTLLFSLFGLKL